MLSLPIPLFPFLNKLLILFLNTFNKVNVFLFQFLILELPTGWRIFVKVLFVLSHFMVEFSLPSRFEAFQVFDNFVGNVRNLEQENNQVWLLTSYLSLIFVQFFLFFVIPSSSRGLISWFGRSPNIWWSIFDKNLSTFNMWSTVIK